MEKIERASKIPTATPYFHHIRSFPHLQPVKNLSKLTVKHNRILHFFKKLLKTKLEL